MTITIIDFVIGWFEIDEVKNTVTAKKQPYYLIAPDSAVIYGP